MLYPFEKNRKTGYIDATGKVVIRPKFVCGGSFAWGVASVSVHNEVAFIDVRGRELFRVPQATHREPFGPDGLAYVSRWDVERERQRSSFWDTKGKERRLDLDDAGSPREGLAIARRDRGDATTWMGSPATRQWFDPTTAPWGYADARGNMVIEERFSRARAFHEGRAAVAMESRGRVAWGYVDAKGKVVGSTKWDGCTDFREGVGSVGLRDDRFEQPKKGSWDPRSALAWGLVDEDGKTVLAPTWRLPLEPRGGSSPACEEPGVVGIIDLEGRWLSAARFSEMHPFEGGTAPARDRKTGKWGLAAADGSWVLAPAFESMRPFDGPLAHFTRKSSKTPGKTRVGYVDARGDVVCEFSW